MNPVDIFSDMRHQIIWLDLKPESTLNLVELAKKYGVSRTPVVIALNKLEVEGWVVRHGSHFVVSPLTINRMREITEIRAVIEPQANIWAMYRMSPEGKEKLQGIKEEILTLDDAVVNKDIVRMDSKFHNLLYAETHNEQLYTQLTNMLHHYLRFWLTLPAQIQKDKFFIEHFEIIKAIEEQDELRLRAAGTEHIKVSMDEMTAAN